MSDLENKNTQSTKTPNLMVALIPIITMGLLLGVGYGIYQIRPQVLLVAADSGNDFAL